MTATLAQSRFKVDRTKLIEALEKAIKRDDGSHTRAVERREKAIEKARAEIAAKLKTASAADVAFPARTGYDYVPSLELKARTKIPPLPRRADCDLKNTIAVLKMSSEPTVSISAEQYSRYFPCDV